MSPEVVSRLDAWLATDDYVHYMLDGAEAPVFQGGEIFEAPGGPLMLNRTLPHVWKLLKETYGLRAAVDRHRFAANILRMTLPYRA